MENKSTKNGSDRWIKVNIANRLVETTENHKASFLIQWWTTWLCMILLHIQCWCRLVLLSVLNSAHYWNPLRVRLLLFCHHMSIGSLSKHNVDRSVNVIWKCDFAFLQLFLNYSNSLCLKNCAPQRSIGFFKHRVVWHLHCNLSGINFGTSGWEMRGQNWIFVIICSCRPHNCKTGHLTS